ncbi:TfpX/TfpZ family type IV pilin accessory protein [Cellvibrio mixtus]|uniref:TfpX/TfpZ family type IV pilin accessory protein n=1 Tax=Cellvibrio mixtus TaxID=39650 RepID=UPI00058775AA|nr:TfpX/TfpZ family type IV pilin accessory protein [Cellvibrio mixtus]
MSFRLRCFLLHLLISLGLAFVSVSIVFGFWYPPPIHKAVGATAIFLLLLAVDVVLGPLLTFILAVQGKKYLSFDFSVVALLQISAFLYGLYVVAEGRAVWLVFNVDRFDLVQAYQVNEKYRQDAIPKYQSLSWTGPKLVSAQQPKEPDAHSRLVFESVKNGIDLPQRPDLYTAYEDEKANIVSSALELTELNRFNSKERVIEILKKWPEADAYLPMMSRTNPMVVLINRHTIKVIATVELSPW